MTHEAFKRSDWQAVIEAHRLESHEAAEWLRYGSILVHTLQPDPEAGKQHQQAALAFVQAQREGASTGAASAAQRQAAMANLRQALEPFGCQARLKKMHTTTSDRLLSLINNEINRETAIPFRFSRENHPQSAACARTGPASSMECVAMTEVDAAGLDAGKAVQNVNLHYINRDYLSDFAS